MNLADVRAAVSKFLHQMITGADNETVAIGRALAIPFALVGWGALPFLIVKHVITSGADAGAYLATHAGSITLLVRGTSGAEPPAQ
jgi:hypothetical protein